MDWLWWLIGAWGALWFINNQYVPGQTERKLLAKKDELDALLLLDKASKMQEKERRVRVKETRTRRRAHLTIQARELKAIEKVLKPEDRQTLAMLPLEQRRGVYAMYGLKEDMVEKWLQMAHAELERKKLGLE